MYILAHSRQSSQWFVVVSAIIMFILSTADVALTMRILGHDIVYLLDPNKHLQIERLLVDKLLLFVTNK